MHFQKLIQAINLASLSFAQLKTRDKNNLIHQSSTALNFTTRLIEKKKATARDKETQQIRRAAPAPNTLIRFP